MMHSDEARVAPDVAELLIAEQFPQWADLPVRRVAADGTVNAIYRIGDGLVARFPLRHAQRAQLVAEAAALREFAQVSTVLSPVPVGLGEPGHGHPLPWSVQTWVPGALAADEDPGDSTGFAHDLASLIRALRAADTRGRRFTGSNRGGDLRGHDPWVQTSSPHGTCSAAARARSCAGCSAPTTSSGSAGGPGRSSSPSASSGTTPGPARG